MELQANFLDDPDKVSQCLLLPFKEAFRGIGLPENLEIVFEQAAEFPQFGNGGNVHMSHQGPASEKTPSHIFGEGQPGGFRLSGKARFFFIGDANRHPLPGCSQPAICFFVFHAPAFENARSATPSIRGYQGGFAPLAG